MNQHLKATRTIYERHQQLQEQDAKTALLVQSHNSRLSRAPRGNVRKKDDPFVSVDATRQIRDDSGAADVGAKRSHFHVPG